MGNGDEKKLRQIEMIQNRTLQKITHLICSDNLVHDKIPTSTNYPCFHFETKGQYSLDFYDRISEEELSLLESISPHTALGRYAERLLAAWFTINPNYDLIDFNHQLIENGTTVGEIDFLIWEKINKQAIHLEFALKFYLEYQLNGKEYYIGPKGRDSLSGKTRKLVDHQLKLTKKWKHLMEDQLKKFDFIPQLMLKGYIFYPIEKMDKEAYYVRISEMEKVSQLETNFYVIEKRKDWIYPFHSELRKDPLSYADFKKRINKVGLPTLCYMQTRSENDKLLMIVEDHWPEPSQ